jgi:hypothetical protein
LEDIREANNGTISSFDKLLLSMNDIKGRAFHQLMESDGVVAKETVNRMSKMASRKVCELKLTTACQSKMNQP